jgi:hypothetical protein
LRQLPCHQTAVHPADNIKCKGLHAWFFWGIPRPNVAWESTTITPSCYLVWTLWPLDWPAQLEPSLQQPEKEKESLHVKSQEKQHFLLPICLLFIIALVSCLASHDPWPSKESVNFQGPWQRHAWTKYIWLQRFS